MTSSALKRYGIAAALVVGVYAFLPDDTWLQTGWFAATGLATALAIVVAARRRRVPGSAPWLWFAAGIGLNALGSLVESVLVRILDVEDPFPGVPDFFYFALYPCLAIGLVMLIRRRSPERNWAAVRGHDRDHVRPGPALAGCSSSTRRRRTPSLGLFGHVVSIAYPVGDIVLLAMLVRPHLQRRQPRASRTACSRARSWRSSRATSPGP